MTSGAKMPQGTADTTGGKDGHNAAEGAEDSSPQPQARHGHGRRRRKMAPQWPQQAKRPAVETLGALYEVQPGIRAAAEPPPAAAEGADGEARRRSPRTASEEQEDDPEERTVRLLVTWSAKAIQLDVRPTETISQLKGQLAGLTNVLPKRQKLIGLVKGKLPADDVVLGSLSLKDGHNILMMGTAEADILDPDLLDLPEVLNDFDIDYADAHENYLNDQKNRMKLTEVIKKTEIQLIHPPRDGKSLLVMDLDYTLFDCKSTASSFVELMRPGMHELLAEAYRNYDIVIWSQTSWKSLELKVTELGILTHSEYKITFVLDITSMFSISGRKSDGSPYKHQVKPLDIIWSKFSGRYSPRNTVHVDDLSRNFALNPQNGLKISAFKNSSVSRHTDCELYPLARYLTHIARNVDDFRTLDHKKWRKAVRER